MYLRNIRKGMEAQDGYIGIEELPEITYVLGSDNKFEENEIFHNEFVRFCQEAPLHRINLNYPIGGYYTELKSFLAHPGQPDNFYSLDPFGNRKRAPGKYLVGYKKEYYGEFGGFIHEIDAYVKKNKVKVTGPLFIIYVFDEISVSNPQDYMAQIVVKVA